MIIENQTMVTDAVLEAVSRAEDPRLREILQALVRHLHGFVREVRLTEREFQQAAKLVAAIGQKTTASHNEAVLMAGSLGVSALVCLLNNGNHGQSETQANMLGPFWRDDQPLSRSGDSLVRSPTPGPGLIVHVAIEDGQGLPVAGAEVDVWHSSPEGLYENQDPTQAEMNLRGRFVSDEAGRFDFRSVKPAGYPIPVDGPVGELVRATRRHNYRPAHLHFMIYKPGFKTMISQIYSPDDEHIDSDVQFGVTRALIGNYIRHDEPSSEPAFTAPWYSLDQRFVLEVGDARRPIAPIRGKATAESHHGR
ncbi:MAG TPA: dioxygenase [Bradyrhizobium sp.]|uniref:dioxygenase family protein n=1 Tax=Bradyrhizobium sp. TaxID=376 RepID=UPI002D0DC14C|nr:dioxygenase [Bradyrhizobium sp.]HTA99054.1 dioxygenase [Bradyrhizobium sp.]